MSARPIATRRNANGFPEPAVTESFILRTSSGVTIMSYETRQAALEALLRRQKDFPKPLAIFRQRIVEERVA
jgi:hypothetical protein